MGRLWNRAGRSNEDSAMSSDTSAGMRPSNPMPPLWLPCLWHTSQRNYRKSGIFVCDIEVHSNFTCNAGRDEGILMVLFGGVRQTLHHRCCTSLLNSQTLALYLGTISTLRVLN